MTCALCHRVERRGPHAEVLVEGGARRPRSPVIAGFAALRRVRAGAARIAGACPRCGGPLIGPPGPSDRSSWSFAEGPYVVPLDGRPIAGEGGPWTDDDFEAMIRAKHGPRLETGGVFGLVAVVPFFFIVFPWLFAMCFAVFFIVNFLTS